MKALKICGKVLLIVVIVLAVIAVISLLVLKFYPPIGDAPDKDKQKEYAGKTELYYDKQFHNENDFTVMTGDQDEKSSKTVTDKKLPAVKIESVERAADGELKVTWLGHSTSLIQLGDKNIFIDPVLSDRSSPVGFAGPERFSELAL